MTREEIRPVFEGKRVAIVGSGPGCLDNAEGFIDGHDVVLRVNNFKLMKGTGKRTDVYYSFFGDSIRPTAQELQRTGVTLCMCKCPNGKIIDTPWHQKRGRERGVDWRIIYERRKNFWFCDTYVPTEAEFLEKFTLLDGHVPTTGFAAILDVLALNPKSIYLTGFDFFSSGRHNVNEKWKMRNLDDPIGHVPRGELEWLIENQGNYPFSFDATLQKLLVNPLPPQEVREGVDPIIRSFDYRDDEDLRICDKEGFAYQADMTMRVEYAEEYFNKCRSYEGQEIARKINDGRVALVARHYGPGKVLDIGVGSGEFIKQRPDTFGFDINPVAMGWLRERGLFTRNFYTFRAFTFWDVLEHVPEPNGYFKHMRPGSFLFASLPIFTDLNRIRESKHYRPGEHLYYFTESGFVDWMKFYGFRMIETTDYETRAGRESILSFAFKREWA